LEVARRIEVEAFLSTRPEAAARVMSDLRTRDELRVALAAKGMARPATTEAARRLERGLGRDRIFGVLQRAAAAAILIAAGWLANGIFGPVAVTKVVASPQPPAYVEEAVRAHRTTLVREAMTSQREAPNYNPGEIRAATAIVMPSLPG
ncbi:anti-sigma factor, partial [Mesorhizobium sp. M4A.F.Ca.ET.029.04.2.1]